MRSWSEARTEDTVRRRAPSRWLLFVVIGVALAALGIFAMGAATLATFASVLVLGWVLIVGGVLQAGHAIYQRDWGGRVLDVLTGVLFLVVGVLAVIHPVESAVSLTLVIAAALIIRGIFAIVAAASERYLHWGWSVAYGVVSVLLGLFIVSQWPGISLFLIGLFVGIELLVDGVVLALVGVAARTVHRGERRPPAGEERRVPGEPLPAT